MPVGSSPTTPSEPGSPADQVPNTNPADVTKAAATKTGISKALTELGILSPTGGIGKNALPLGLNVGSALVNRNANNTLQKQLQKIAAPASSASEKLLAEGTSGQVPPAIMQQFDQTYKDTVQEITQRYANMGRDAKTDSAAQAEIAKAKQAMDAQVANYAASLTSQGLSAAGVASGPATQAALAGAEQDRALQQSMAGTLQQMALLEALSKQQGGTTT